MDGNKRYGQHKKVRRISKDKRKLRSDKGKHHKRAGNQKNREGFGKGNQGLPKGLQPDHVLEGKGHNQQRDFQHNRPNRNAQAPFKGEKGILIFVICCRATISI